MSTTSAPSAALDRLPSTDEGDDHDLTDLYTLLVHESPEVCSNCHRRVRAKAHANSDVLVQDDQYIGECRESGDVPEPLRRGGDGVAAYDVEQKDDYGAIHRYEMKTYCGGCGQPGGRARDDVPSKREMLDAVGPLVDRLDELDIPVNVDALEHAVGHLRSKPRHRGSETEIWRAAVAVAAKRARPRDCVRCSRRDPRARE